MHTVTELCVAAPAVCTTKPETNAARHATTAIVRSRIKTVLSPQFVVVTERKGSVPLPLA
jgi:hypothetical protein